MFLIFLIHFFFACHAHNHMPWSFPSLCQHQYAEVSCTLLASVLCLRLTRIIPTSSIHSRREYWAVFQHCLSINDICLERILFTFLTTETSNSSIWKFSFKPLIFAVSEAIVVLACSLVLKNESIIWFLFNAQSVSSIYTPAITSTRFLQ